MNFTYFQMSNTKTIIHFFWFHSDAMMLITWLAVKNQQKLDIPLQSIYTPS